MKKYPREAVSALVNDAIRSARNRSPRRTAREAAAERLVAALVVLLDDNEIDPADAVAFQDARTAAEKYR